LGALASRPVYAEDGASALENTSGVSHFRTDSAAGCPYRRIMIVVFGRIDGSVERSTRNVIQRCYPRVFGPTLSRMAKKAVLRTAQDIFALDKAFSLIEGHPLTA
jgi:hypothetical protein